MKWVLIIMVWHSTGFFSSTYEPKRIALFANKSDCIKAEKQYADYKPICANAQPEDDQHG